MLTRTGLFQEVLVIRGMGRLSANGSRYLLLPLLFLALSSMAGAVSITFYASRDACDGNGFSFNGVDPGICCVSDGGSVLYEYMASCYTYRVYVNGGCDGDPVGVGFGDICWIGGGYTGASWTSDGCGNGRSLLVDAASQGRKCKGLAKPTGVVFTDAANQSTWSLTSPDAAELFSQLESLPRGERANWLQSKGATLRVHLTLLAEKRIKGVPIY